MIWQSSLKLTTTQKYDNGESLKLLTNFAEKWYIEDGRGQIPGTVQNAWRGGTGNAAHV